MTAQPMARGQRPLVVLVLATAVALFAAMPLWRWIAEPPPEERYALDAAAFEAKVDAMTAAYATGAEVKGVPVVHPPPGDVYLLARRWQFHPVLELDAGAAYRLHVASVDVMHGFHSQGLDRLLTPGSVAVLTIAPDSAGRIGIQCSEFCGAEHNKMTAQIIVTDGPSSKK